MIPSGESLTRRDDNIWYIKNCGLFEGLGDETADMLAGRGQAIEIARGAKVYGAGDPGRAVYLIKSGGVKIAGSSSEGKEIALALLGPLAVFGETALADSSPRDLVAVATQDSRLIAFDVPYVEDLMRRRPSLGLSIAKLMGLRLKKVEMRLQRLMFRTPRQRVATLLLELGQDFGQRREGGQVELMLRVTHQDIASLIGVTRESVSYAMGQLELDGLIQTRKRRIFLADEGALARL